MRRKRREWHSSKMKLTVLFVSVLFAVAGAQVSRYDNYKVYRVLPKTDIQVSQLRQLEDNSGLDFDFWKGVTAKNVPVDIMVPPHKTAQFQDVVNSLQLDSKLYISNVQQLIDESSTKTKTSKSFDWSDYHRGSEIDSWLNQLAKEYPDKVTVVIGGKSYEKRDIVGVKVSFKAGNKGVFLETGIHAREWIGPATVTYILNELLTSTDSAVRNIAESYDWYVFPSTNPDGYEYTHTHDRLWRKTRQPHGLLCKGADPNRNWGYHWMDGGASSLPCAETYAGSSAFSEPETKSLSEYITSIQSELVAYIAFHSYSQLLLIPYGHTNQHLDNYMELMDIGQKAATSLAKRYGTKYTVGNIVDVIYVASGGSMDWVKGNYKTPITYTYELRDTGRHGFVLPPEQIIPTSEETFDSLLTILEEAKSRGY